jgi:hypothetical protein
MEEALVLVIYFLPGFSSLLVVLWREDHCRDSEQCRHYLILGRFILYCGLQDGLSASSFGHGIDVFRTLKLGSEYVHLCIVLLSSSQLDNANLLLMFLSAAMPF